MRASLQITLNKEWPVSPVSSFFLTTHYSETIYIGFLSNRKDEREKQRREQRHKERDRQGDSHQVNGRK